VFSKIVIVMEVKEGLGLVGGSSLCLVAKERRLPHKPEGGKKKEKEERHHRTFSDTVRQEKKRSAVRGQRSSSSSSIAKRAGRTS